jgi:excisionase family DNA binding protein
VPENESNARRYASVATAAAYLSVTDWAIRQMIADGRLTGYRGLGSRMLRVDLNEIDEKIASQS